MSDVSDYYVLDSQDTVSTVPHYPIQKLSASEQRQKKLPFISIFFTTATTVKQADTEWVATASVFMTAVMYCHRYEKS
jgi:hypothetical protein